MAMENICLYNKFGHCKYQETCRRQHLREICELPLCENKSCMRRHPRTCKFFMNAVNLEAFAPFLTKLLKVV